MESPDRRPWNRRAIPRSSSMTAVPRRTPPGSGGFCDTGAWRTCVCSTADGRAGKRPGSPSRPSKPQTPTPTTFQATLQSKRLATKGQLLAALKDKSLQIVDARSEAEFCGIDKQKNKRAGAIPGAKHLEWIDLIDKETQRFKTADQLRTLFRRSGHRVGKANRNPLPVRRTSRRDGLRDGVDGRRRT